MKKIELPEMNELRFESKGHVYLLDGIRIPSVTELMRPMTATYYKTVNEDTLANAATKGTAVHEAAENYIKFGLVDIDEEYKGYIDAFTGWYDSRKPDPVASEMKFYHKILRYGGTADLLCILGGRLALVDYKTTSEISRMLVGVQLEAYKQALRSHGIEVEDKIALHLKKDGTYSEQRFALNDLEAWECFAALRTVCIYQTKFRR